MSKTSEQMIRDNAPNLEITMLRSELSAAIQLIEEKDKTIETVTGGYNVIADQLKELDYNYDSLEEKYKTILDTHTDLSVRFKDLKQLYNNLEEKYNFQSLLYEQTVEKNEDLEVALSSLEPENINSRTIDGLYGALESVLEHLENPTTRTSNEDLNTFVNIVRLINEMDNAAC